MRLQVRESLAALKKLFHLVSRSGLSIFSSKFIDFEVRIAIPAKITASDRKMGVVNKYLHGRSISWTDGRLLYWLSFLDRTALVMKMIVILGKYIWYILIIYSSYLFQLYFSTKLK